MRRRWRDTVVYELHVKGFTQLHDRVPEELRGTYAGLGSPAVVEYLRDLGVTAVELLPGPPVLLRAGAARARAGELLGLQHDQLLLPRRRLQLVRRPRRAGRRVQADGEEPARRRHRGDPRRGLQPHRRGRPARADHLLPRPGRPRLLQAGAARTGPDHGRRRLRRQLLGRHRLRQHRRLQRPARAAADPGLAALLGHRDARRRLPLRPDVGADPHRLRHRHELPAAGRHRPGPGAAAREADRRAVGRVDGRLPGRPDAAAVGGVERPVPRRDPGLLARPRRPASAPSRPGSPARRTSTPTTGGRRTTRSTSSPPTTASRCATW